MLDEPIRLFPIFRERVWGRESLAPYYPDTGRNQNQQRIGEVWFTFEENATSAGSSLGELIAEHPEVLGTAGDPERPGICPLLMKMLFTSERMSVQVHPDDQYAAQHHHSLGKTEAWYVLDAQPPGEVAAGFRVTVSREQLKAAAQSGEIADLIEWRKVKPGEVIFIPAGTVHAIGAGLTICEIQENSDITYRLYDYGRPRELHLEHGVNVSSLVPHQTRMAPVPLGQWREQLLECPYFRMERLRPSGSMRIEAGLPYYLLLLCVKGSGSIAGQQVSAGQAWLIPAANAEVQVESAGAEWILTYRADKPMEGLAHESAK